MSTEEIYRRFAEVALDVARNSEPDVAKVLHGIAADYLAKVSACRSVGQQQQQPQPKSDDGQS
jgi:hypothetical protein